MTVVMLASLKGGVGKSSTTVLLGAAAFNRGLRFLVADLDPQATSSVWLGPNTVHMPRATVAGLRALDEPGLLVLVDPPAGEAPGAGVGLEAADRVVAVTGPSWVELATIPRLEAFVDLDGVILTRVDTRKRLHREAVDRLEQRYGPDGRLLGVIPLRAEVETAAAERRPPALGSAATEAAARILERMAGWVGEG